MNIKNKLQFVKSKWFIGGVIVIVIIGGYFIFNGGKNPTKEPVTVIKGSISEAVLVTGSTVPVQSSTLSFGSSGIIGYINGSVGKSVYKGQVLAQLNAGDLYGQLQQAKANVSIQQAKLDALKAGSRPEDIASSKAGVDKATQDLSNIYSGIPDTSADSYTKANDAVRVQLNPIFSNDDSEPKLSYVTVYTDEKNKAETERLAVTVILNNWVNELPKEDEATLQKEIDYLRKIKQLLNYISTTLQNAPDLSSTTVDSYKANVTTALAEVNTASKNLNTILQNIASQKLVIKQLQSQLELKEAGTLSQDIAAQVAQVKSAEAGVASAQSKFADMQIVSPISGIITQFDAKLGQFASAGSPLVSVISNNNFEIESQVPETDSSKIKVGNKVNIMLDAYPDATFLGTVSFIYPTETVTQGVVNYKIKIAFSEKDERIKSGLTANLTIETRKKDNVLILPQYAILQNDEGTFVQVKENDVIKNIPVTLGISDQNGNVEIVTGVTEGQQVLNIGLK